MQTKVDYTKLSLIMNGVMTLLLIGTLVYFLVFHESPIIERYQSEIATLKTKNEQLVTDFENLQKEKEISKKITEQLDKGLNNINKELKSVNYEIYILNKNRNKKEPFVNNLPNDSIASEFTKYLQRRNQTR
jgi:peptidoglycan hydrolase CwlO-like protein